MIIFVVNLSIGDHHLIYILKPWKIISQNFVIISLVLIKLYKPYHKSIPILYADWTASGRLYNTIEEKLNNNIYPYVANTYTDTNDTAKITTQAYHKAKEIIKQHV